MRFLKKLLIPLLLIVLALGFVAYKTNGNFSINDIHQLVEQAKQKKTKVEPPVQSVPYVRTAEVRLANKEILSLSGIVKARNEVPLAFQIGGRITLRKAEVGSYVQQGQILFQLDNRDFQQGINTANADVNAAEANVNSLLSEVGSVKAQLLVAASELKRTQSLHQQKVISTQILEQAQLAAQQTREQLSSANARVKAAKAQVGAAKARLAQAGNTEGYSLLKSPQSGILLNVTGEIGQVVSAGQAVAVLAQDGPREIEVAFPDHGKPPEAGVLMSLDGKRIPLSLREVSATVDPQSRTLQIRYTIKEEQLNLGLGAIVRTEFDSGKTASTDFVVPISALDERATGAQVWQVIDGRAKPKPVSVIRLTTDTAVVRGDLVAGESLISLGTHLLTPGMVVQELSR